MIVIRIRYQKRGGHYHCRVFTAPGPGLTFANCGDLVFDEREWPDVYGQLTGGGVQFLMEGERDGQTDAWPG